MTAHLPGGSPERVEAEVLAPLEASLLAVPDLEHLDGMAAHGEATLSLVVDGDDPAAVLEALQAAPLPPDADPPTMMRVAPSQWFAVVPEDAERIRLTLEREPGVEAVLVHGLWERRVVVHLDPARLAAYGVSPGDLAAGLRSDPTDLRAGAVASADVVARVPAEVRDVGDTVIATRSGVPVRLSDVAAIEDTVAAGSRATSAGTPIVLLEVLSDRDDLAVDGRSLASLTRVDVVAAGDWARLAGDAVVLADETGGIAWLDTTPDAARDALAHPGLDAFVHDPGADCIDFVVAADDLAVLETAADGLRTHLEATSGTWTRMDWPPAKPELTVSPDRERLAALGLHATDVSDAVALVAGDRPVTAIREGEEEMDVVLVVDDASDLTELRVGEVPIAAVATVTYGLHRPIPHVNTRRAVVVTACGAVDPDAPLPMPAGATIIPR